MSLKDGLSDDPGGSHIKTVNKRPMDYITHLRNQIIPIYTFAKRYDYII